MKRSVSIAALLAAVALATSPALPAGAEEKAPAPRKVVRRSDVDGTIVAKLDNGLTVIVKPMRIAPVVCVRSIVHAGSMYEAEFLGCGISHLVEHLVAKGALHDGANSGQKTETRSAVSEIGGQSNASTSSSRTQYYISAASGKAMQCIDLIADWMSCCEISADEFQREHGVVQRELELGKDDARRQMWYAHSADAFGSHPAAVPIIGYAKALQALTVEDVRTYHRRMYVPDNMVFTIVGDVDGEAALQRACKAFAGFDRGRTPDLSLPKARALPGVIRTVGPHAELKEAVQEMSFQTIGLVHEDLHALDVLSTILGRGESSRLATKVRREQRLVTNISCGSWTPDWGKGLFNVSFRADPNNADKAEAAVLVQLRAVAADGVTEAELARAKRQMIAEFVHSQQSVESVSSMLATDYLTTGDVTFSSNYTKRIQAVTAEQVRAMARKYFTPDRMAITRLVPPEQFASAKASTGGAGNASTRQFTLDNGLRVVLNSTDAVDLASMAFATKGGLLAETPETNGLGSLMAAVSTKGAGELSAQEIAEFFAKAGGRLAGSCGNNAFYWQATVLNDSFDKALDILADVVQRPTFDENELEILRPSALAAIGRVDESWSSQLQQFFRSKFFPGGPYGMLSTGCKDVVGAATAQQVAAHHKRFIKAGDSVLAVFGNFDAKAAEKRIRKLFADVPPGKASWDLPGPTKLPKRGQLHVLKTEKKVAGVIVAAPGMTVENLQDRFAVDVLDTIISGYRLPGGWLHTELRGKQLVYVVHAYNWMGLAPGAFVVYAAGQPEKALEVIEIIRRNLRRAAKYKPTREEIAQAVNVILTAELLGNQSLGSLAMSAALDELYGFGYDFRSKLEAHYAKVTPADVARVAKKYLSGGLMTVVCTPAPELVKKDGSSD